MTSETCAPDTSLLDAHAEPRHTHHTTVPRCAGDDVQPHTCRTAETLGGASGDPEEISGAVVDVVERITRPVELGDDLETARTLANDVGVVAPSDGLTSGDRLPDLVHGGELIACHTISQPQTVKRVNHKRKPLLLDLFCGAGGAAWGYTEAGFEVIGVDLVQQPHYPFEFHRGDALAWLRALPTSSDLASFDAVHASPPCKRFTVANRVSRAAAPTLFDPHPDLLAPTFALLAPLEVPWIVENVPGAPMLNPVTYCGSSFGLRVRRHRLFSSNISLVAPPCDHASQGQPVGVYGNGGAWTRKAPGGGGVKVAGKDAADALGVTWTDYQPALSQMIPPAYTRHIGQQLMEVI